MNLCLEFRQLVLVCILYGPVSIIGVFVKKFMYINVYPLPQKAEIYIYINIQ